MLPSYAPTRMCRTDIPYPATVCCYAVAGTDIAYAASRHGGRAGITIRYPPTSLPYHHALSPYDPTLSPYAIPYEPTLSPYQHTLSPYARTVGCL
eukprot:3632671-Rhodomonas_salina.2